MTFDEAQRITLWMRDQGVVQFSCDGLAVQFHPRAVSAGAAPTLPKIAEDRVIATSDSQETDQANLLSRVFSPP